MAVKSKFAKSDNPNEVQAEVEAFLNANNLSRSDVLHVSVHQTTTSLIVVIIYDDGS